MIAYEADTGGKILLLIMQTLNQGIYILINTICQLFINISKTTLFSQGIIDDFLGRIYVVLGILMLFKLAFSLLTAIVNPDALTDKEKGMQKIIPRTIIALVLLIMTPTIFNYAMEWQEDIAMAVPRIIIGVTVDPNEMSESNEGELLASTALKAFISPTEGCGETSPDFENANSVDDVLYLTATKCSNVDKTYMYQFNGFVSMFVGIFLVVFLASYCIDIAIRTIKIGLLRILAPIPIISYIDPKSEKSGAFGNWLKECISTYLELFIKLAILYFVLYILGGIASNNNELFVFPEGISGTSKNFIKLFLIMGAFFFMGKAADFICNILGVKKPDSSGGLFKGLAGLGAAIGIGAGAISGAWTNARDTYTSAKVRNNGNLTGWNKGKAIAASIFSGGAGVFAGAATTGKAVAGAKNGKFGAAMSAMNKRNTAHAQAAAGGASFGGKTSSYLQRMFTGETDADRLEREIGTLDDQSKNIDAIVNRADDKARTSKNTIGTSSIKTADGRTIRVSGNYQAWSAAFNAAKAQGLDKFTFNGTDVSMEEAERLDYGLLTSNSECYIKNHGFGDSGFGDLLADYESKTGKKITSSTTRDELKTALDSINSDKSQKNRELKQAKANADATKP